MGGKRVWVFPPIKIYFPIPKSLNTHTHIYYLGECMGRTVLATCQYIVNYILKGSNKKTIKLHELEKAIMLHAGGDPRTIENYKRYLSTLNFIKIKGDKVHVSNQSYPA